MSDQKIWQWTLTKDAIAPCFVRDVLNLRQHHGKDVDFFWLGHTPCRTVLLVGIVVAIQVYDKRAIYTIDDGTAVIDCILRHPHPAPSVPVPPPPRSTEGLGTKSNLQCPSPKKPRLDTTEPPPPITDPGYPVRVVGKVVRHYQSKQIYAETIDPCASSLDEIAHLERVIELHKTKYSRAIPFVLPPPKSTVHIPPCGPSTSPAGIAADANVFFSTTSSDSNMYTLPPPPVPMLLQNRNRPSAMPTHHTSYPTHAHVPSSPTASSIASSTPSSPCKQPSPVKSHEAQCKLKLRHPSRLHTHDLTGNTFRLYVKHYLDNAPPPFPNFLSSPTRSTFGVLSTPTKHTENEDGSGEPTPRPRPIADETCDKAEDGPTLGFTLSHLRRVPELALLAARVVRAERRKREKADRAKEKKNHNSRGSSNSASTKVNKNMSPADPPRKKMKRLFSWAVVKLHEEGSIVLWDGDVRPLPVPPPLLPQGVRDQNQDVSGLWKGDEASCSRSYAQSTLADLSASVLYTSSVSASLYSQYQAPRRPGHRAGDEPDADVDLGYVSDPEVNEEAYVPLTPRLLAGYVNEAVGALRRGRGRGTAGTNGRRTEPTPDSVLSYLKRTDGRWARVGLWAVEEALAVLNAR